MSNQQNQNKVQKQSNPIETLQPNESSLKQLITINKDKLIKRACDSIRNATPEKQDQFLERLIVNILNNGSDSGEGQVFDSYNEPASHPQFELHISYYI